MTLVLVLVLVGALVGAALIYRALTAKPTTPGQWHVCVVRDTFPHSGRLGRLGLADGQLSYTPASMVEPAWSFPAADVRATSHPIRINDPATVDLQLPDGTTLALQVSTRPLDGTYESTLDDLLERRAGHNLIAVLAAHAPR